VCAHTCINAQLSTRVCELIYVVNHSFMYVNHFMYVNYVCDNSHTCATQHTHETYKRRCPNLICMHVRWISDSERATQISTHRTLEYLPACVCVHMYLCMYVCTSAGSIILMTQIWTYWNCMYVCMYVCMYWRMQNNFAQRATVWNGSFFSVAGYCL
jgi:hypothetical protein